MSRRRTREHRRIRHTDKPEGTRKPRRPQKQRLLSEESPANLSGLSALSSPASLSGLPSLPTPSALSKLSILIGIDYIQKTDAKEDTKYKNCCRRRWWCLKHAVDCTVADYKRCGLYSRGRHSRRLRCRRLRCRGGHSHGLQSLEGQSKGRVKY